MNETFDPFYFKIDCSMRKIFYLSLICVPQLIFSQTPLQKFEFVNFAQVNVTDNFWKPKIDKVATAGPWREKPAQHRQPRTIQP